MDNRYFKYGCPALMQDGRFLTNYVRGREIDQNIRNLNKIDSVQEFKLFLQQNGDDLLNRERAQLHELYTCDVSGKCVVLSNKSIKNVKYSCDCNLPKLPIGIKHIENMCDCKSIKIYNT